MAKKTNKGISVGKGKYERNPRDHFHRRRKVNRDYYENAVKAFELLVGEPLWFVETILGKNLWEIQKEILMSVHLNKKTTVKACHGVGKSFTAGNIAIWYLFTHQPSIVITTAPTMRQVEKLVWKEIRASYANTLTPLGGELLPKSPELQILQDEWYAVGISTDNPDRMQGFHEDDILVIVDEAAGVEKKIYDGIEGIISSDNAKILLIGNPTSPSGYFFDSFKDSMYKKFTISAFNSPNFTKLGITEKDIEEDVWEEKVIEYKKNHSGKLPQTKMVSPEWVRDKYLKWKPGSPLYEAKVRGNFPDQGEGTLIPLSWIESSIERWKCTKRAYGEVELGVDVAEDGTDLSAIAPRQGSYCHKLETFSGLDLMSYVGQIIQLYRKLSGKLIKVDVIGMGTGVEGRLREQGFRTTRVKVSESPGGINDDEVEEMKKFFYNKRSQLWWSLRELLNPDERVNENPIALPPDDELVFDLSNIKYTIDSKGKIVVEPKKEFRKRMGRSPDRADSVVLAFAPNHLLKSESEIWTPNIR